MKIKSIRKTGKIIPTWDIEVLNQHCYLLDNGVVSHNTISLSLGNNASNGIEPSFAHHYTRNVIRPGKKAKEDVDVYSAEFLKYKEMFGNGKTNDELLANLPSYFVSSGDLTPEQHVDMQAAAQKWVDSSISKTVNVPANISYEDFCNVYLYGYDKGLKGCALFRPNPENFQGVIVRKEDLKNTKYRFKTADGKIVEVSGDTKINYEGDTFTAANLYDSISEGFYGKL